MRITHYERKVLLAAGATAGMSAIFGSPIAAIFLAIELLLFEFSPRSIIPVTLACITGAAGHHLLFASGPVFPMHQLAQPGNVALGVYSVLGIILGLLAALTTRLVYFVEDSFEKLPVHWMWWPAIGGLGVGIIGYFAPRTLGVGYNNITDVLSGGLTLNILLALCLLKFISWAIALGSGTSGGTLAPLLTIGGATGALIGALILRLFPNSGINIPMAALVGMSAMFAGASRALLTSIIFAVETTGQSNALLPLLAACTASFFISYLLLKNTIMTEKIARRGIRTPHSYEPDILEKIAVEQVLRKEGLVISSNNSIKDVREWLKNENYSSGNYFVIVDEKFSFKGIVSLSNINSTHHDETKRIDSLIKRKPVSISKSDSLRTAVEVMAKENLDVLPVISKENEITVVGILTYKNILSAYKYRFDEHQQKYSHISLKRGGLKMLLRGKKLFRSRYKDLEN
jgi:CBS domain-containing protein